MKTLFFNKKAMAGLFFIAVSTVVSCKKLIVIPSNPPTSLTRAEQFADSTTAIAAVAGVYTYNQNGSPGFPYSDANLTISTGLSANEFSFTGGYGDAAEFYSYTLTPINGEIGTLWQYPYQSLYQVNDILNGITNNSKLSASFVKQITGEMKFVRAFYYFNMVNLFGGVPLITSTDFNTTAQLPRSSANVIYAQILADLTDAVKKLPVSYPSAGTYRPNLYTAMSLFAKVHLYQKNWQAAYNEADSIIKSGSYSLEPNLNNVFLDGSVESIWQLPAVSSSFQTNEALNFIPFGNSQAPTYTVTSNLLNQFEAGDQRLQDWIGTSVVNNQNFYYPFKYKNVYASSTPVEDYMVFRLGEIYLIRAEAAAELNNLGGALADVNTIRARAGLSTSTANVSSQAAVLAAVAKERQTELCFEWGNRWFDLNRTGQAASVLPGYQSYDALYPIPQAQLQLNSHLIQNPGYH